MLGLNPGRGIRSILDRTAMMNTLPRPSHSFIQRSLEASHRCPAINWASEAGFARRLVRRSKYTELHEIAGGQPQIRAGRTISDRKHAVFFMMYV